MDRATDPCRARTADPSVFSSRRGPGSAGFTLIELLVVLFILGLVTSVAVLSVGGLGTRQVAQEAERLVMLMRLMQDESLLTGQERAMGFAHNGYGFLERQWLDDRTVTWVPLERAPLQPRWLDSGVAELRLRQDNRRIPLTDRIDLPHVRFDPAGLLTPFELEMLAASGRVILRVTGERAGRIHWESAP
jgi:general secretion pathway protein H